MQGQDDLGEEASARGVSVYGRAGSAQPAEWAEGEHFDGRVGTSATTLLGGSGADMGEKVTQVMPVGRRNQSGSGGGSTKSGRRTSAASERDATAQSGSQQSVLGPQREDSVTLL